MSAKPIDILLVEDDPSHADLTVHVLRKHRVAKHIKVLRDGAEAIAFLFDHAHTPTPRMILLDLGLPKIDGLEVLRRIKEDARLQRIPVVILTGSRDDNHLQACFKLGVNSYIVKPVDFQQFADAAQLLGLHWVLHAQFPV